MVIVIVLALGVTLDECSIPPQFSYNEADRPVIVQACGDEFELMQACYDVDSNTLRLYTKQAVGDCKLIFKEGFEGIAPIKMYL